MNTPIVPFTSQDLTSRRNVKRVKIQSFRLPRTVYTFTVRGGGIITIIHPLRKNRIRHHFPMMSPYEHPNFINHCPISGRRKFRGMVYVKKSMQSSKKKHNITVAFTVCKRSISCSNTSRHGYTPTSSFSSSRHSLFLSSPTKASNLGAALVPAILLRAATARSVLL